MTEEQLKNIIEEQQRAGAPLSLLPMNWACRKKPMIC